MFAMLWYLHYNNNKDNNNNNNNVFNKNDNNNNNFNNDNNNNAEDIQKDSMMNSLMKFIQLIDETPLHRAQ